MKLLEKAVAARRKDVAAKFVTEAINLERKSKHKPAAIRFEYAVPLIDDTEEQAFILYSSFVCYKLAGDYRKAHRIISSAAYKYRSIGESEAADTCEFERDRLHDDVKPVLRFRKGVQTALRGCFADINPGSTCNTTYFR